MNDKQHSAKFKKLLVGRKIVDIRYMTEDEAEHMMWNKRPLCLILDDGSVIIPQMDDEGNDGGAMCFLGESGVEEILYVLQ